MSHSQDQDTPAPAATSDSPPTVIIIGAGIVGLTCAVALQAQLAARADLHHVQVLMVAREWPDSVGGDASTHSVDYASMWAGAHVRPIPAETEQLRREAAWLKHTVAEFDRQVDAEPWCGIARTGAVELFDDPSAYYRDDGIAGLERDSGLRGWRLLPPSDLPTGVRLGLEYESFCVNAPVYCEHLLRKFVLAGGKTVRRELRSEAEAFALRATPVLVVNASGMGFGDEKCFPTRGQTVLTDLSVAKTVTRQHADDSWSYIIPRSFNGGTIHGGVREPNNWSSEPDPKTRERILSECRILEPFAQPTSSPDKKWTDAVRVIRDMVGRRPTRIGGVALEVREVDLPDSDMRRGAKTGRVVRAYGLGGRGFELSWGLADDVVKLAMTIL